MTAQRDIITVMNTMNNLTDGHTHGQEDIEGADPLTIAAEGQSESDDPGRETPELLDDRGLA
jgi:hypothetical protein